MINKQVSVNELALYLNALLNVQAFEENSFNGIQVTTSSPIRKIATGVTASIETIEKAILLKAQVLIVHHGIFLKNDPQPLIGNRYKKIKLLMDHNIALLAYHLPLDAHQEVGNNWKAAKDLGLRHLKPFLEINKVPMGVIGFMSPMSFDIFTQSVEQYYGNTAARVKVKDTIASVAIISGGADKCITDAAKAGADCFITGRFDEPVWDAAHEENISFLGLGHYATETVGVKGLVDKLQQQFNIPCTFIKTGNPF